MQYMWWADEDYRYNDFELLTSKEVHKHFFDNIKMFSAIQRAYDNYNDPEILNVYSEMDFNNFTKANVDKVLNEWIKQFAEKGINLSYDDVKPLADNLKFEEARHLIVETFKGFIVFTAYPIDIAKDGTKQILRYEFLPKFEECKEWLEKIKNPKS